VVVVLAAAAGFATLSLSPRLLFSAAYAEHFVLPPVLAGVLVLLHAIDRRRMSAFFGSGLLFGTAFLMKQSGGAFTAPQIYFYACRHGLRLHLRPDGAPAPRGVDATPDDPGDRGPQSPVHGLCESSALVADYTEVYLE
jgi:hypothetical protein